MSLLQDIKISAEQNGDKYSLEKQLIAQKLAWSILKKVDEQVQIGMSEQDINSIVKNEFDYHKINLKWHETKVRIGPNTICSFSEKSSPDVFINKSDIYFIDLGPVINEHEADVGQTFYRGSDNIFVKACADVKEIFTRTANKWKDENIAGEKLYLFAKKLSQNMGWLLVEKTKGHRISDFPHALYHKGKLKDFSDVPSPYAWVLEIQIRHPIQNFGAFYEDILQ